MASERKKLVMEVSSSFEQKISELMLKHPGVRRSQVILEAIKAGLALFKRYGVATRRDLLEHLEKQESEDKYSEEKIQELYTQMISYFKEARKLKRKVTTLMKEKEQLQAELDKMERKAEPFDLHESDEEEGTHLFQLMERLEVLERTMQRIEPKPGE